MKNRGEKRVVSKVAQSEATEVQHLSNGGHSDLSDMKLFSGNAHRELACRVADHLGQDLGRITATRFSDGEIRVLVDESARGNDVFLLQPTCNPVNDSLMELLIMLDAFRRASARRITVVIPYFGYARQDKKTKPREPITARLVADLIQVAGAHRVVGCDLHAEQIMGFFDIPVDHLYAGPILGNYMMEQGWHLNGPPPPSRGKSVSEANREGGHSGDSPCVVVSPDVAGVTRARALAEMLDAPLAIVAKRRPEPNRVDIVEIVGEVKGKRAIMIDDMIDTGGSVIQGAEALLKRGAVDVVVSCTHPVLSGNASQRLQDSVISRVITMDTIPIPSEKLFPKLTVLPIAPLLGEAIRRIHTNQSVSSLFSTWR